MKTNKIYDEIKMMKWLVKELLFRNVVFFSLTTNGSDEEHTQSWLHMAVWHHANYKEGLLLSLIVETIPDCELRMDFIYVDVFEIVPKKGKT